MSDVLSEAVRAAPQLLAAHIEITGLALGLGATLGVALALVAHRSPRLRAPVSIGAGIVQTIPSLALLALMVPLLGMFGFVPALCALVLYSVFPIVRATLAGLDAVPGDVLEAADALGMTSRQRLRLVELPLALPIMIAGLRTASAWVVGTATLTTPVGQSGLGNLIFSGLQTRNGSAVLVGCVAAAGLALVLDALFAVLERATRERSRRKWWSACLGVVAVFGFGLALEGWSKPEPTSVTTTTAAPMKTTAPSRTVVVGAKTFTEQYVLAELIASRLTAEGLGVERTYGLGSTVAFDALRTGKIDVYVDYSGTLWANVMKRTDVPARWRLLAELTSWLAEHTGVRLLGALGFENAYAFAMRRDRANVLGVKTIADLGAHAATLRIGGDYELFQRPEWIRVREAYGLAPAKLRTFDPAFLYDAVVGGDVDAITAFSSDGRIRLYDLVVLEDAAHVLPPYDAVILVAPERADDHALSAALSPLVGAISAPAMREANLMVDRADDKRSPREAAAWLESDLPTRARPPSR